MLSWQIETERLLNGKTSKHLMSGTDCFQVSSVMSEQIFFFFKRNRFLLSSQRGALEKLKKDVLIKMEHERSFLNEKTEKSAQMSAGRCAPMLNCF